MPMNMGFLVRVLLLLNAGQLLTAAVASGQAVADQCVRILPPRADWMPQAGPRYVPDSTLLEGLDQGYYGRWPSSATLDSIRRNDRARYFDTFAMVITGREWFFGAEDANAAASQYHLDGGPPELVLWALDRAAFDWVRETVLISLPDSVSVEQQITLLRAACVVAVQVEAMSPSLPGLKALDGQDHVPLWYYVSVNELRLIRRRLTGTRRADFERIIGPVLSQAEYLSATY